MAAAEADIAMQKANFRLVYNKFASFLLMFIRLMVH
jgi:hypothetical protein